MSGIYNGPDGQKLHGDGRPVRELQSENSLAQAPGAAGLDRKCRNGDTGRDLFTRKRDIEDRLAELRNRAMGIKALLRPIEESIESESMSLLNIETRINVWRQEQNARAEAPPAKDV